ncbi:MAG: MBL fold metallo-hydrolase [Candidatus Aenigmarchaeota archaeon]|nr:MBL fold metallo-hydrolase [Candidatus Aenigmarchaeota archaeon]
MNRLIFLGSGGGRHMIRTQERKTAGIYVELDNMKFVFDPGPCALLTALQLKLQPEKWNGAFVTHMHIDHCSDANAILDSISSNAAQPLIIAEKHCIEPKDKKEKVNDYYPCISAYHQNLSKVYPMEAGKKVKVNNIEITAVRADHYDPTIGFIIKSKSLKIGFTSDSVYYNGMEKFYSGCDLLVVNTAIPMAMDSPSKPFPKYHMGIKDLITMLKNMEQKPKLTVIDRLTGFMVRANIWKQVKIVQDATKCRIISSEDHMEIDLDDLNKNPRIIGKLAEKEEKIRLE